MAKRTAADRIQTLRRLRAAIVEKREGLAAAIFQDFHKPVTEVELSEIHPTLEEIDHAIANLADWMAPKPVPGTALLAGTRSELRYEPKGVALILATWNYPFNLAVAPLVGAIAAGNCVILKPSEKAPATARLIADLVREVFDECEVAAVEGDADLAQALLELPFDHVFFTGSTRVGRTAPVALGAACDPGLWSDPCASGAFCAGDDGGYSCRQFCDPMPTPGLPVPPCPAGMTCESLQSCSGFVGGTPCQHVGICG